MPVHHQVPFTQYQAQSMLARAGFKKSFGLKNNCLHGEITSADTAEAEVFVKNKFIAIIEEGGHKPDQVFNMDETGLFWK